MERMTRQQVEAEIERAKEAEADSGIIREGEPYPSSEDIYPQITYKNLSGEDLSHLDLSNAYFNHSDLRGVNFSNTKLVLAELNHTDLRNTTVMDEADFRGAGMTFAKLQATDLSNAILVGNSPPLFENVGSVDLDRASYDDQTKWPPNFNPDEYGAIWVRG